MKCVILVAGHGTQLESDIRDQGPRNLVGIPKGKESIFNFKTLEMSNANGDHNCVSSLKKQAPYQKALLPGVKGKKILDSWWCCVNQKQIFSDVYLVTNADKYKHYERWATANGFPIENIINDGTTTAENSIGAVTDFQVRGF